MARSTVDETQYVADAILAKVFQGDPTKEQLALHIARVAVRAHWAWGDGEEEESHGPVSPGA